MCGTMDKIKKKINFKGTRKNYYWPFNKYVNKYILL